MCANRKGDRDSYDRLLASLSKKIDESRDDIKNLVKHISINVVKAPIPGIKKGKISDIPLNPTQEDYPGVRYWNQKPWQAVRRGLSENDTASPIFSSFMEDEYGQSISAGIKSAVFDDVKSFWVDMHDSIGSPKSFSKTGLMTKEKFRNHMEGKYPWLRLCEAHWKVNQLWINYFTMWKPNPSPKTSPDRDGVHTIEIGTSDSDISIGSKRGREDVVHATASKKLKGKQVEQPVSRPTHPQPKKLKAKVAKVSLLHMLVEHY